MKQALLLFAFLGMGLSAAQATSVTADPASGSTVASLSKITLTFDEETSVDNNNSASITICNAAGEVVAGNVLSDYGIGENQMVLTFDALSAEGTYTVNVPAERYYFMREGGEKAYSEAFSLVYTIAAGGDDPDHSFNPDGTVGYLYSVDITFNTYAKVMYKWNPTANQFPYLIDAEGNVVATGTMPYDSYYYGTNTISVILDDVFAVPGTYTLVVPDGACLVMTDVDDYEGVDCSGFTHQFVVTGEGIDRFTNTPSAENPARYIDEISITFTDETLVAINPAKTEDWSSNYCNIINETTGFTAASFQLADGVVEGNAITFRPDSRILAGGNYCVKFSAGSFLLGESQRESSPIKAVMVVEEGETTAFSINPEPEQTYSRLQEFEIVFTEAASVEVGNQQYQSIYLYDDATGYVAASVYSGDCQIDGNKVTLTLNKVVTDAGNYHLAIPVGYFYFDGDADNYNTSLSIPYNIDGTGTDKIECSPASGSTVTSLETLVITYPDEEVVAVNEDAYINIYGYSPETGTYFEASFYNNGIIEGPAANQVTVRFDSEQTETGKYSIALDAGYFLLGADKRPSTSQKLVFYVDPNASAIETVATTFESQKAVYTLDGRRVKQMSNGLYIVNGRIVLGR